MKALISVIVMAVVTYIPRVFPLVIFRRPINNVYIRSFLYYVPYGFLSAQTVPAILLYNTGSVVTAVAGTLIALFLAYLEQSLVVVAIAAILVVYAAGTLV